MGKMIYLRRISVFIIGYLIFVIPSYLIFMQYKHTKVLDDSNENEKYLDKYIETRTLLYSEDSMRGRTFSTLQNSTIAEDNNTIFSKDNHKKSQVSYPRILCWVMTSPDDLLRRTIHIQNTWARHCDIDLYMSSEENKTFPAVGLNVTEGRNNIGMKSKASWTYIYEHYRDKADYFMKVDPDSFIIIENLKHFLTDYDPSAPEFFGHIFNLNGDTKKKYMAGGSGVILSQESLKRLVTIAFKNYTWCMPNGQAEDFKSGYCLGLVGCTPMNTTDSKGRERFMVFNPKAHLIGNYPEWYLRYDSNNGRIKGINCCSDFPIGFHYIKPDELYLLYYLIYNARIVDDKILLREDAKPMKDLLLKDLNKVVIGQKIAKLTPLQKKMNEIYGKARKQAAVKQESLKNNSHALS
ncbi:unnamed protein product [Owenia fusiformis]|uniref:N-acetylgalactosaminide beta-1,3-galactosyltransferase n=1 Tax=Owenia fusiformis TaxID=6347 RepID=A0A8S4P0T1_OWEFU|nr:unnamed protein product [Owenia fusiformis]